MNELKLLLWGIIQAGIIGMLWGIPIFFWAKVLIVGTEGLYALKLVSEN